MRYGWGLVTDVRNVEDGTLISYVIRVTGVQDTLMSSNEMDLGSFVVTSGRDDYQPVAFTDGSLSIPWPCDPQLK